VCFLPNSGRGVKWIPITLDLMRPSWITAAPLLPKADYRTRAPLGKTTPQMR
jgi:hypothetical protein